LSVLRDALVADRVDDRQFDQLVGEQMECPATAAFGRMAAGRGDQFRLGGTFQFAKLSVR